jgi:O-antigen ligase
MFALEQFLQSQHRIFCIYPILLNALPVLIAGYAILSRNLRDAQPLRIGTTHSLVLLLALWAIFSVSWSVAPEESTAKLLRFAPYFAGFCIVGPLCVRSVSDLADLFKAYLIVGAPLALGLSQVPMYGRGIVLSNMTLGNPLAVGSFGAALSIIAVLSAWTTKKFLVKTLLFAIAVLGIVVCLRSGSRGQLIAAGISMVAGSYFVLRTIKRVDIASFAVALIIMGAGVVYVVPKYLTVEYNVGKRWEAEGLREAIVEARLERAASLLKHYEKAGPAFWIVGLGTSSSYKLLGGYCHIVPVEVLCELGIIGFAIFATVQCQGLALGLRLLRSPSISLASRTALACMISLFASDFVLQFKQGSLLGSYSLLSCVIVLSRVTSQPAAFSTKAGRSANSRSPGQGPRASAALPNPRVQ